MKYFVLFLTEAGGPLLITDDLPLEVIEDDYVDYDIDFDDLPVRNEIIVIGT